MIEHEIISLRSAEGNELKFKMISSLTLDDLNYVVLSPVDIPAGLQDNQALVFKVQEEANGIASLNIVTDVVLISRIYERYHQMMLLRTEELAKKRPSGT